MIERKYWAEAGVETTMGTTDELIAQVQSLLNEGVALSNASAAKFQQAAETWRGMGTPTIFSLDVPWIGQNVAECNTDDYSNSDCGPASLAMWIGYLGRVVTVDQVSVATGLPRGFTYTLPAHLITAAGNFGLNLKRVIGLTHDMIKAEIDKRNPLIVLVHYGSLPKRSSATFTAGHWLMLTGYTVDGFVIYNDPLWQDAGGGKSLKMSLAQLDQAMADCAKDGNTINQGLMKV